MKAVSARRAPASGPAQAQETDNRRLAGGKMLILGGPTGYDEPGIQRARHCGVARGDRVLRPIRDVAHDKERVTATRLDKPFCEGGTAHAMGSGFHSHGA